MTTKPTGKPVSIGICAFCKAEVAKNKMTQHLKFCKERLATLTAQEKQSRKPKTRLFHILAEGRYNPQYWLHFEVPASESLWTVDSFLKAMWIDDLEHLSGFTINGTSYNDAEYSDDFYTFSEREEQEEEEISEEEQAKELSGLIETVMSSYSKGSLFVILSGREISLDSEPRWVEWVAEIKKPRSIDELVDFLKEEQTRIAKEENALWKADQDLSTEAKRHQYTILRYQKMMVKDLLTLVEDRSMDVLLQRVLKVGQKFSYIYDYGSSTYINLRVIAEREGIVQNKEEPVRLLAQNAASQFACVVCGKPATRVALGYYTHSIENDTYCSKCAKKHDGEGGMLPITNSPRTGVL